MTTSGSTPKLRVLVPDYLSRVTGTIVRWIAYHNRWIEPTICSMYQLRDMAWHGAISEEIDLISIQIAEHGFEAIEHLNGRIGCVASIHHVENERILCAEPRFARSPRPRRSGTTI